MRLPVHLLLMCALFGCRSDERRESETTDRVAPTVTLSSPKSTIEGGEALLISVLGTDDRDSTVPTTLTCDGGTLVGNVLTTSSATNDLQIVCRGSATDAAGNTGSGTLTIAVRPTSSSVALGSGYTALSVGQFGIILADNLTLDQPSYQGSIDGRSVTLTRSLSNTLMYEVPRGTPAGSQRLNFAVGAKSYSLPLAVSEEPAIADPVMTVRTFFQERLSHLNSYTDAQLASMSAAERAEIADAKSQIGALINNLGAQPADELRDAARFLTLNKFVRAPGLSTLAYDRDECLRLTGAYLPQALKAAAAKLLAAPALAREWLRGLVGLTTRSTLLDYARQERAEARSRRLALNDVCMAPRGIKLERVGATGQARATPQGVMRVMAEVEQYGFEADKPAYFRAFQIERLTDDIDNTLRGATRALIEAFGADPNEYVTERSNFIPPNEISLGSISHVNVLGQKQSAGELIVLTFEAKDAEEENIDFTFNLRRTNGDAYPIAAQLTLDLPEADPVTIDMRQNRSATQPLVTRGAREVQEVFGPARNGSLSLTGCCNDNFSFTYTPRTGFFGTEVLAYRARNTNGFSKPAAIVVRVNRDFTGRWNLLVRERVTSQSSPNLCSNSDTQSSVIITKISDFSYVGAYAGFQVPLRHENPIGAAGLVGSFSGTYDEDDGETTETLTVEVPDSDHLTGRSTWTYRGRNGGTCSGTTEITGTR